MPFLAWVSFVGTLALLWKGVPLAGRGVRAYWRWSFPECKGGRFSMACAP